SDPAGMCRSLTYVSPMNPQVPCGLRPSNSMIQAGDGCIAPPSFRDQSLEETGEAEPFPESRTPRFGKPQALSHIELASQVSGFDGWLFPGSGHRAWERVSTHLPATGRVEICSPRIFSNTV